MKKIEAWKKMTTEEREKIAKEEGFEDISDFTELERTLKKTPYEFIRKHRLNLAKAFLG